MRALADFLDYYSEDALLGIGLVAAIGSVLAGTVADRVMRHRGFGVIGNAVLVLAGIAVALVFWHGHYGPMGSWESDRIMAVATASATAVLLVCGVIKSIVLQEE
jgi:small-conductance mechanosensitive channel